MLEHLASEKRSIFNCNICCIKCWFNSNKELVSCYLDIKGKDDGDIISSGDSVLVDAGTRVQGRGWDDLVEIEMVAPSPPPPIPPPAPSPPPPIPPPAPLTPPSPYPTPLKVVLVFVFWGGRGGHCIMTSPLLAHVVPLVQGKEINEVINGSYLVCMCL